ncbi:tetratricopeptide repeat protein [Cyclobacteriaceae bacterium]|nr:tetratricopeptide repeat protein [Cyclobacteriaceae bacterium]
MKILAFSFLLAFTTFLVAQSSEELYNQALTQYETKEYKKGLKTIEKAIDKAPKQEEYYILKANLLLKTEGAKAYLQELNLIILKFPNYSYTYIKRGSLYSDIRQLDRSLQDYERAIVHAESDSVKLEYITYRAGIKSKLGRYEEAYKDLALVLQNDSLNPSLLTNIGIAAYEIGHKEEAFRYFRKTIKIDSTNSTFQQNIGFFYQRNGDHELAIKYLTKALSMMESNNIPKAYCYNNLAYSKLKTGDTKGALKDVNTSLKIYELNPYAYRNRALIYIESGKKEKACEDIQRSLDLDFTKSYGNEVLELQAKNCK